MATIIFDGTSSQTASKSDTVVLTANPAFFTGAAESNGNVVLTFGSQTLTVTGTTLAAGNLSNVSIPNGQFIYATAANAASGVSATGNTLAFLLGAGSTTTLGTGSTSSSVSAAFGGIGRADSLDNAETVSIASGAKGSYLIYGNNGADSISAGGALDSNTATTVFGGRGVDTINLGTQSGTNSNFAIYGGEDGDSINITHTGTGSLTIFGGTAAADSADGADTINLGTGTNGTINVFAGGGADIISSDGTNSNTAYVTFTSGSTGNFYGGDGADTITVGGGAKASILVAGGAGADSITVQNLDGGATTIYGGTGVADSTDGADNITVSGGGSFLVYGNGGNDVIVATGVTAASDTSTTTLTIIGGRGDDNITAGNVGQKINMAIYGSENAVENTAGDSITTANNTGGSTIIYGGTAAADSTDGKDLITVTGGGTTTIYAAGGDDTVNLAGANSTVSTSNSISVFGGTGNDSVALGTQVAANGTITIDGGAGADSISIISNAAAPGTTSIGSGITINNFATGTSGDKLLINNGTALNTVTTVDGSSAQTLQQALDLAAGNAVVGQVTAVVFQGNAYAVVNNDGASGYTATADLAIKLTGLTDVSAVAAAITVS